MNKKLFAIIFTLIIVTGLIVATFIFAPLKQKSTDPNKLSVVASFYPIAEFTRNVGRDQIEVTSIIPAGVEPHDFEPTSQDIINIQKSKVFIYNSAVDIWAAKIIAQINQNNTKVYDILESSKDLLIKEGDVVDPHIWLDPQLAIKQITFIKEKLQEIDAEYKNIYEENTQAYIEKLSQLDKSFNQEIKTCEIRDMITAHEAFNYLGKRYNINITNIAGLSPEEEPSAQKLSELKSLVTEKKIKYIFFETLATPKTAETLARETNTETLVLNPLEGLTEEETKAQKDYIAIMYDNLSNIKKSLRCQ